MADLFDGKKLRIGRTEYIVPALNIRQLKKHKVTLSKSAQFVGREPTDEEVDEMVEVIHAALSRNYPDISIEQLQDTLDLNNIASVMAAIAGLSGLEPAAQGEA